MAVPKRKMSRANTRARRSQWKASLPHQAKVVTDAAGNALFLEYKGRKVADA